MEQIKCAGRAGIISYVLWEWAFWVGAGGVASFTYYTATGGWPDLSNPDDQAKVGGAPADSNLCPVTPVATLWSRLGYRVSGIDTGPSKGSRRHWDRDCRAGVGQPEPAQGSRPSPV